MEDFKKKVTKKTDFEIEKAHMIALELRTPVNECKLKTDMCETRMKAMG